MFIPCSRVGTIRAHPGRRETALCVSAWEASNPGKNIADSKPMNPIANTDDH